MNKSSKHQLRISALGDARRVRESVGISDGFRPVSLTYNEASRAILIAAELLSPTSFEGCLFVRTSSESRYSKIPSASASLHFCDVVSSTTRPTAYCRVVKIVGPITAGEFSSEWLSIAAIDLDQRTVENIITKEDLVLSEHWASGLIFALHGVSADEAALYCTCGLQKKGETRIEHWLCRVRLAAKNIETICRLEGIWF